MGTTPRSYLEVFVEPNLWDFEDRPEEVRLAFNACVSAFQLADIFFEYCKQNDPAKIAEWPKLVDLHIYLESRNPSYTLVQSLATAYKHLIPRGAHYEIMSPGAVVTFDSDPTLKEVVDLPTDGPTFQCVVFAIKKDGSREPVLPALKDVVENMWPSFLSDNGF